MCCGANRSAKRSSLRRSFTPSLREGVRTRRFASFLQEFGNRSGGNWRVSATIATEGTYETQPAQSLLNLVNIASFCGRSIRLKGNRANAAARQSPTYGLYQRARDHCWKTCGERGDQHRGGRFETRPRRIGVAHSLPGQNAD